MKTIGDVLAMARTRAKLSQEYMALELGVARKTVQNWEKGKSEPTVSQAISWFQAVGESPLPFLLAYIHPEMEGICGSDEEPRLRRAFLKIVEDLPEESLRQLLYLFYGDHGSSPTAIMQLVTAHLQCPMKDRISHGTIVAKNYEIALKKGRLTDISHIQPDMMLFHKAIEEGERAFMEDKEAYTLSGDK